MECTWQAVSNDHYSKFIILRSVVLTQSRKFVHRQKRLLRFQNEHFLYFLTTNFAVFNFGLLNFHWDSLILKVWGQTPRFEKLYSVKR